MNLQKYVGQLLHIWEYTLAQSSLQDTGLFALVCLVKAIEFTKNLNYRNSKVNVYAV